MLQIRKRYRGMKWNTIYFAEGRVKQIEKHADIIEYNYLTCSKKDMMIMFPCLCEYKEYVTLSTNLKQEEEELFGKIEKNCRYEIRRAEREKVDFVHYDASIRRDILERIIEYYNNFVDTKEELTFKLSYEWLKPFLMQNAFWCTEAVKDSEILALHLYYCDDCRVRLWFSASLFRSEGDKQKRNEIGRANRFLHWRDLCFFKKNGFSVYDWGGYSVEGSAAANGKFKKSFGGDVENGICLFTYGSLWGKLGLFYRKIRTGK